MFQWLAELPRAELQGGGLALECVGDHAVCIGQTDLEMQGDKRVCKNS
jgi:hypothetical protein